MRHNPGNFRFLTHKLNWRVYTDGVMLRFLVTCSASYIALIFSGSIAAQQSAPAQTPTRATQPGVVLPHEVCATQPDQSYALYLPSTYTPAKRWPTIYAFDPLARGSVPLEFMKDAAERYGFILVGSNNSRNDRVLASIGAPPSSVQTSVLKSVVSSGLLGVVGSTQDLTKVGQTFSKDDDRDWTGRIQRIVDRFKREQDKRITAFVEEEAEEEREPREPPADRRRRGHAAGHRVAGWDRARSRGARWRLRLLDRAQHV